MLLMLIAAMRSPVEAVAARVHDPASHVHEAGGGQREVDVVEVESGLDAQRLAFFFHPHAGIERGDVGGRLGRPWPAGSGSPT